MILFLESFMITPYCQNFETENSFLNGQQVVFVDLFETLGNIRIHGHRLWLLAAEQGHFLGRGYKISERLNCTTNFQDIEAIHEICNLRIVCLIINYYFRR